jgi:hypothetical protein
VLRNKLRAFLGQNNFNVRDLPKFEDGIWRVLKGGVFIAEEGHFQVNQFGIRAHTIYDLVRKLDNQVISIARDEFKRISQEQRKWVEGSWLQVCDAYLEIKKEMLK